MCKLAREYVAEVSPALDDLKAKTGDLGNKYVDELVATMSQIVVMQVVVLNTMAQFKKPEDVQFLLTAAQTAYAAGDAMTKDMKSPLNLVKAATEAYQLALYPAFTDPSFCTD